MNKWHIPVQDTENKIILTGDRAEVALQAHRARSRATVLACMNKWSKLLRGTSVATLVPLSTPSINGMTRKLSRICEKSNAK